MKKLKVIGVSRGNKYSPNMVDKDAAIFNLVTEKLREKGWTVEVYSEEEFVRRNLTADVIYNMARDAQTIDSLCKLEDAGAMVINSGYGIKNCGRQQLTELLQKGGVPYPKSFVIATDVPFNENFYPCWFKRGDSQAVEKNDVNFASSCEDANRILEDFQRRKIKTAVVSEHLKGDLVKFYGVRNTDFFDWYRSTPVTHSKFGLEVMNGEPIGYEFDVKELKSWSDEAARILNVPIYGGDCVVAANGSFKIIDFNDWPSFSYCCDKAGVAIADCIVYLAKKKFNHGRGSE